MLQEVAVRAAHGFMENAQGTYEVGAALCEDLKVVSATMKSVATAQPGMEKALRDLDDHVQDLKATGELARLDVACDSVVSASRPLEEAPLGEFETVWQSVPREDLSSGPEELKTKLLAAMDTMATNISELLQSPLATLETEAAQRGMRCSQMLDLMMKGRSQR